MTPPLAVTAADRPLYRISRRPDAWAWPPWSSAGPDGTFGNRFDDAQGEYRVLYASSQRLGAFLETLARFRRDVAIDAEYALIQADERDDAFPTLEPGLVPADWRAKRYIGTASHEGRFVDVGHSDSVAHLRSALAARLLHYGLDDLDAGDLRRRAPRRFTQELSRYVFETGYDEAGATLAGIRYLSRLGDEIVNWAMFEGADPEGQTNASIERDDPDLSAAMEKFNLAFA
jgi:hypothetical protein